MTECNDNGCRVMSIADAEAEIAFCRDQIRRAKLGLPTFEPRGPEPYSAVNPRPYDPTSDEAVAYAAMLEDIAKIGRLRRENAKLVDRVTKLKACVDLLSAQIAKVPSCER